MKASEANQIAQDSSNKPNPEYEALIIKIRKAAEQGLFEIITCNLKQRTVTKLIDDGYKVSAFPGQYNDTDFKINW